MNADFQPLASPSDTFDLQSINRLVIEGRLVEALRALGDAMESRGEQEPLLRTAADAWVTLVQRQEPFGDWPDDERERLLTRLIEQKDCPVSPPILHHRISAQHASGVAGHLALQAKALAPMLQKIVQQEDPSSNGVIMLLLLRSRLEGFDQDRISALHAKQFAGFKHDDLAVPYSVTFERVLFKPNVEDVRRFVREQRGAILSGDVPLGHVVIALWLAPDAFARFPTDWPAQIIAARSTRRPLDGVAGEAARSLAMRFDGPSIEELVAGLWPAAPDVFLEAVQKLAAERAALAGHRRGGADRAAHRLDKRSRQALGAIRSKTAARLSFLRKLGRRPKVAICVSGQLRGYRAALESWRRNLLPSIDATFFVHSWYRVGRSGAEPFRYVLPFAGAEFAGAYRDIGLEIGLERLQERYPSLFTALGTSGDVDAAILSDLYATPHVVLEDDAGERFAGFTNPDKMYHKVEACFGLVEASGDEFDLVIRLRPDKPIHTLAFNWSDMLEAVRDQPRLYVETAAGVHYGALLVGDQFAIGGFESARVYAQTASRSEVLSSFDMLKFHRALTGHVSQAQVCWLHGIEMRKAPIRFGKLQDAEPLAAEAIRDALATDTRGRDDHLDRQLVAANAADLKRR